jgi:hypothetical protein
MLKDPKPEIVQGCHFVIRNLKLLNLQENFEMQKELLNAFKRLMTWKVDSARAKLD